MKYIIELPEEVKEKFDNATKDDIYGNYYDYNSVIGNAIKNGTPLKEHGRLIDEPTEEEIAKTIGGKNDFADCIREAVKTVFANAPTIIEADTAESEDKE